LLETRNLSKSFGGLQAINDVSLTVDPNTVHGLIGPNGSGKSTFFNLLTGVYEPDKGIYIEFDNVDVTGKPAHYIAGKGLSRTFQLLRLYGELSVLDNVLVGFHPHTKYSPFAPFFNGSEVRRQDKIVKEQMFELLEFIGLSDHAEIPAAELSGGQRRLLALGRAIAMRPKMLLLDEPGAGLSPANIDNLMDTIMTLKDRYNLTIIVVEHILKVVMATCDTISVLDHGQKISEGTPKFVKNDPAVVEAYLGREMADEDIRAAMNA
ncbi:MAG: ABC transporter ATP-binding protein, partial [Paracoccaceae bacterium]|nr:ABC transporter ATP-binding protein [Paracoccaceae bacterium]